MSNNTTQKVNFDAFKQEWLEGILTDNPSSVQKGRRFARKLIQQWLDFNDESDEILFCDGAGDGGIDAAYFQKSDPNEENGYEGDHWYLIQSKYGKAFTGTDTLLIESQKVIDTLDGKRDNLSSLATELLERLRNFRHNASDKDKLTLVFATILPLSDAELRTLDDIKSMGRKRFGNIFEVSTVNLPTIYNRLEEEKATQTKTKIEFTANVVQSGSELLVGSMKLINLYEFLKTYQRATNDLDLIYEKNVRKFLGRGKKVNIGIAKTINESPELFGLYNNGITIVVEDYDLIETDKYELTEPFIVNGCQTTKTVWNELKKKVDSGGTALGEEYEAFMKRLNRGILVVKIVKVGSEGEELLINTTKYTNSQNAVSQKDFIALEKSFKFWASELDNKYNVYLEIQRGGWDSERAKQQITMEPKVYGGWANSFDLLKIYGAGWLDEPGLAYGKNPPFAPGGSIFKRIVESDHFGTNELYASYLLFQLTKKLNFGRNRDFPTRGQTKYLFCFIFIKLLKDVMVYAAMDIEQGYISKAVIKLLSDSDSEAAINIYNSALQVIDEYMTNGMENSVYTEPKYTGDSNAFLKDTKIGKSDDYSPKLVNLIALQKQFLRMPMAGNPPLSKVILETIK
jgi:hypothetical protein